MTTNANASISSAGTPMYAAPELLGKVRGGKIMPFKPDIYSLGLTTCFLMSGELPDAIEIHKKEIPFKAIYSEDLKDLAYSLLVHKPDERPLIEFALVHPAISKFVHNIQRDVMH